MLTSSAVNKPKSGNLPTERFPDFLSLFLFFFAVNKYNSGAY